MNILSGKPKPRPEAAPLPDIDAIAEGGGEPLSTEERARVLSATRLKFTLTLFVVTVLLALSAMIFTGVTRIFDWLTPTIRQDLEHKVRRGAAELAQTAQLGMVVGDVRIVTSAVADYANDHDVVGLQVLDSAGRRLYRHGNLDRQLPSLLAMTSAQTHDFGEAYGAWMPSEIEGARVGSVAVFVSKARLEAGMELRREILLSSGIGCLVALLACLVFVNLYIGPILRVTGEAFVRLERTTEAALAAVRLKSHFLANMSHEIRTPMNGVIGVLDLLNRTALSPRQLRYTQTIETSARGLLTIINDVLDFSKLEAGKYELRYDDFEVHQLVQEVAELLSPKAHAKQLELVVRTDRDVPHAIRGDVDRLKQVLLNLVGNAVKFTDKGHIELRVSLASPGTDQGLIRFSVTDTGLGIKAEDQKQLFGVFSQVDGSMTRKYGGTGLGLAISKRLAEAMGGTVGVESEAGKGSTFWFTIRAEAASELASRVPASREAAVLLVTQTAVQGDALRELIQRWGMVCEVVSDAQQAADLVMGSSSGFTAAVIDGSIDAADEANRMLYDLCTAEGLPVIRLLSTTQMADHSTTAPHQSILCKPVRASELYNGLVALLDGGVMTTLGRVQAPSEAPSGAPVRGRVLVVDDNEINRLVAVELLTELGYDADTACNGLEGVDKARSGAYGAILMDCQMPELDGFQATHQIRRFPDAAARVPIIALTAHAMADDRDRVLRAGMDDYASKPIRARVLDRLLRRWINSDWTTASPAEATVVVAAAAAVAVSVAPVRQSSSAESDVGPDLDPGLPRSQRAIELFLKTVPELIEALTQAVSRKDTVQVKQLAHKLKGNCLSLGATRMAAACHVVEVAALHGTIDVEAHSRIPSHLAVVAPLLSQLVERRASNDS